MNDLLVPLAVGCLVALASALGVVIVRRPIYAAIFLLVQSCLGLHIDGVQRRITFSYPLLPEFLGRIRINNLRLCDAAVDLHLERHGSDVGMTVLLRDGDVDIVVVK